MCTILSAVVDWAELARERERRFRDGAGRVGAIADPDERQRQLTRMGNAAGAAGLAYLMASRPAQATEWLRLAAERYGESWPDAPPGSWGRPIGAVKALLLAGDREAAERAAAWPLEAGAARSESPIGRYAAVLALLVLGRDDEAAQLAAALRNRDDFPPAVADALFSIAVADREGYALAAERVLESFETRTEYLEEMPVADTVLVFQALAARRDLAADLRASPLLPA